MSIMPDHSAAIQELRHKEVRLRRDIIEAEKDLEVHMQRANATRAELTQMNQQLRDIQDTSRFLVSTASGS